MARRLLLPISAVILLWTATGCEDRRADKAYLRGDYDSAFDDLRPSKIARK